MLWDYLADATENSVYSAKNVFWLGKAIFLLLYIAFCFTLSLSFLEYDVSVALLIFAATDLLIFLLNFLLSYLKKSKCFAKLKRNVIAVLGILRTLVRLTDCALLFTLSVIVADAQVSVGQSLKTIILIFSCILLLFIFSKEIVSIMFSYLKYRTKRHFREVSKVIQSELLQYSDNGLIEDDNTENNNNFY